MHCQVHVLVVFLLAKLGPSQAHEGAGQRRWCGNRLCGDCGPPRAAQEQVGMRIDKALWRQQRVACASLVLIARPVLLFAAAAAPQCTWRGPRAPAPLPRRRRSSKVRHWGLRGSRRAHRAAGGSNRPATSNQPCRCRSSAAACLSLLLAAYHKQYLLQRHRTNISREVSLLTRLKRLGCVRRRQPPAVHSGCQAPRLTLSATSHRPPRHAQGAWRRQLAGHCRGCCQRVPAV